MKTTIDKYGRIVIPQSIRKQLGLSPGVEIDLIEENDVLIGKPVQKGGELILKEGVMVYTGTPLEDIEHVIDKERNSRIELFLKDTRKG